MNHHDHVNLIKKGIPAGGTWADLGSGQGAFTLALAECLGTDSHIYSLDIDRADLIRQQTHMKKQFPENPVTYVHGDFTHNLDLPPLDGIVMANSLHFVQDKVSVVALLHSYLKDKGHLIMVEYDTSQGNYAVPYPMTFSTWTQIAEKAGFNNTVLLATRPSRFLGQFFSSVSYR